MDIEETVIKYKNLIYKVCIIILCDEHDAQDAVQDTFCVYIEKRPNFSDENHEKAWLIRVATNISRNMIRFRIRHPKISIDELANSLPAEEHKEILTELLELPLKQKMVIYLYYAEGYSVKEISGILKISENAVKKRMQRGRKQLYILCKEAYK